MEFTGERVIPGEVDTDLWQEHLARYILVQNWVAGGRVLDAGCGTGYGSALLAATAKEVVGVDLAAQALDYARAHFQAPNLTFQQGDCCALPYGAAEFDWVVAYEVIEHLPDAEAFLREVRRMLRPKGRLVVSTPNRRFYSEEHAYHNPFHTREFDVAEFEAILNHYFPHCRILEQNHVPAIAFELRGEGSNAVMAAAKLPRLNGDTLPEEPHFLVALCAAAPLRDPQSLLFLAQGGNVLREREIHIRKLESDLRNLQEETNQELARRLAWVQQIQAELEKKQADVAQLVEWNKQLEQARLELSDERQRAVGRLEGELLERTNWALELKRQIEEKDALILERQGAVEDLERQLKESNEWAVGLQQSLQDTEVLLRQRSELAVRLDADLAERTAWVQQLSAEANALRTDLEVLLDSLWHRTGRMLHVSPAATHASPSMRPAPDGEDA